MQPGNLIVRRLGELGWIEGKNILFDCVSAVGRLDQVQALARELVSRHPDVLTAGTYSFINAMKRETTTIPIVMLSGFAPEQLGLVANLARPEGNVTGVAWFSLQTKIMELLKEVVPNLRRVAFITENLEAAYTPPELIKIREESRTILASKLGLTYQDFPVAAASDYEEIFARLAMEHFDAAYITTTPLNYQNQIRICQLAMRHGIPTVTDGGSWAKTGLLLTYGQDVSWTVARAMDYVDKILRGAKPSELPVEQATKLELISNLKTAKMLGLTVPSSLLARADEVIE